MGFILNLWQLIYGPSSRCFLFAMHFWYTFIAKGYPWALHCQQQQNVVYNNSSKLDLFFSYLVLFSHVSLDKIAFLWSGHSVFKGLSLVFDLGFWIFHLNAQFRGCFLAVYLAGKIWFWLAVKFCNLLSNNICTMQLNEWRFWCLLHILETPSLPARYCTVSLTLLHHHTVK